MMYYACDQTEFVSDINVCLNTYLSQYGLIDFISMKCKVRLETTGLRSWFDKTFFLLFGKCLCRIYS